MYFFRTSEVYRRTDLLLTLENTIISVLENIINIEIDVAAWQQASLPARSGGLGILPPTKLAVVSYLSSFLSVKDLAQQVYAFPQTDVITDALTNFDAFTADGDPPRSFKQREIYDKITEKQVSQFLQEATASDAARLHGAACKGASDWLNAMPSRSLGLHMSDEQLRIAVSFRLGAPICSSHTCWCGAKVEVDGSHAFVCLCSRSRHARHQLSSEIIHKALQSAQIPAELEPAGMFRDDNKRPDGVTLMPWRLGRSMAWDFTCVHRLAASYSTEAATPGPCLAELAESRQVSKYSAIAQTHFFQPVAVETLGGLGPSTLDFVNDLGRRIFLATGEKRATEYLRQRLGVAVQMGNAAAFIETFKSDPDPLLVNELIHHR